MKQNPDEREPAGAATIELVVRRSRFIASGVRVTTREEAEAEIGRVRASHPDASHVVYAFLIGDRHSELAGVTDAGEPRGTAGRPVIEVLRGSGVRDVLITVVRYYGGTRLGTGGLVHAYGDAAREVIERLPTRDRIRREVAQCVVPYELHERVVQEMEAAGAEVLSEEFATAVTITVAVPEAEAAGLAAALRDASRGAIVLEKRVTC